MLACGVGNLTRTHGEAPQRYIDATFNSIIVYIQIKYICASTYFNYSSVIRAGESKYLPKSRRWKESEQGDG